MEKAPNINPMYNPPAPRSWAYTGNSGTTIPAPITVVNIEKKRVLKIFLFSFPTPDVPLKPFLYNETFVIEDMLKIA